MSEKKRVLLKAYIKPDLHARITKHAANTGLSASRVAERLLETGKYPDQSLNQAVLKLLDVNADQARLGNLLVKAINETSDGPAVHSMKRLLEDIRRTQTQLKAKVAGIKT
ncbi:hypothetical protein [Roseibium polysiphoniae]|uniref:hypothetical protein n=1 Tax=Roseibium polysiphoniae TaxID=2571221 RepID=UPI003299A7CD